MGDENVPPGRLSGIGNASKMNKPLMERRRRQRINDCLTQLKSILETLTHKQSSYLSKLEKADILEMTVHCVKNLRQRQSTDELKNGFDTAQYVAGFDACTREVTDCLQSPDMTHTVSAELYAALLNHLASSRRRLALTKSRATVVPPCESLRLTSDTSRENISRIQTTSSQMHVLTKKSGRSPMTPIANTQAAPCPRQKPQLIYSHLANTERTNNTRRQTAAHTDMPTVDLSAGSQSRGDSDDHTGSQTSSDVIDASDHHDALSTNDEFGGLMWRPW